MTKAEQKTFKGYNGNIIISEAGVTITRGVKGFLLGGGFVRGDKTIPYSSIVAIQLKKAGLTAGYIQLTLKGGSEAKAGLIQSTTDENTIHFYKGSNKQFEEAKALIEARIIDINSKSGVAGELSRLAELRDNGILSEKEFTKAKSRLLSQ